jgi:hypothetical protein
MPMTPWERKEVSAHAVLQPSRSGASRYESPCGMPSASPEPKGRGLARAQQADSASLEETRIRR